MDRLCSSQATVKLSTWHTIVFIILSIIRKRRHQKGINPRRSQRNRRTTGTNLIYTLKVISTETGFQNGKIALKIFFEMDSGELLVICGE
jgi:hypothetical protein